MLVVNVSRELSNMFRRTSSPVSPDFQHSINFAILLKDMPTDQALRKVYSLLSAINSQEKTLSAQSLKVLGKWSEELTTELLTLDAEEARQPLSNLYACCKLLGEISRRSYAALPAWRRIFSDKPLPPRSPSSETTPLFR